MAPSRSATSITWSVGTNRNSASLSTNFLMSQGQATRSTLTCSRVIHFIEIFSFSVNMLSSSSSLLLDRLARELRIQCIVDEPPPFQRDLVAGADQAQAPANQIQASSRGLQADLLHGIGLIDHAGDVLQDGIVQIVLAQHGVKRAVSPVMGEAQAMRSTPTWEQVTHFMRHTLLSHSSDAHAPFGQVPSGSSPAPVPAGTCGKAPPGRAPPARDPPGSPDRSHPRGLETAGPARLPARSEASGIPTGALLHQARQSPQPAIGTARASRGWQAAPRRRHAAAAPPAVSTSAKPRRGWPSARAEFCRRAAPISFLAAVPDALLSWMMCPSPLFLVCRRRLLFREIQQSLH